MSAAPFVHLHCHSHYSLLDGSSPIERLVERTVELGMNALAITDHGNLHGALEFYEAARAAGINPIIGYEAYIAPASRFTKDSGSQKEASYHLTLLARDRTGFANLLQLATKAFLEGFYFKPRIDRELLAAHAEGIVCLSGCLSSEFSRALVGSSREQRESLDQARQVAGWFQKTFGDRYFIELQDNGLDLQRQVTEAAIDLTREMGIPPVATCDCHYVNREDAEAQDILLCVNTGRFRSDATRMRMDSNEFYLKSPAEMHAAFAGIDRDLVGGAVSRTQAIADSVSIDLDLGKRHFPGFEVPAGRTSSEELRWLCLEGLRERYASVPTRWLGGGPSAGGELHPQVMERLDRELGVIEKLGFSSYFLIVWDFVRYAREQGIPAAARGSGVGSLVAYALHLSHVCPLEYDLLFERFLDVNRREAPDIDIDFCKERRGEVIEYVKRKYGAANVAQIGTFGTLAARAAIRDVGRALGMPIPRVDAVVALVPDQLGITLEAAAAPGTQLAAACEADAEVRELVDLAGRIEGLARNVGTHAAAVVIADRPLVEYVPLQRVTGKEEVITQWAMGDVERAGLMKMDFLGLRYLTVVAKTVDIIEAAGPVDPATGRGVRPDPIAFPLDDRPTFDLLCRGETKGIFQLESGGIRDLLQRMKPDHFLDIVAVNALYRPGPLEGGMVDDYVAVKHGRKRAEYRHPVMREVLEETHGVMVYQEQVMRILERLGGIELSSAYTCIKAISKKKIETIAAFRQQFVDGARSRGLAAGEAQELFGLIEKFAGYGFNKSHSTAYALLAWQTAYLKTHHPVEFMAALLSGDITGRNFKKKDALVEHVEDCRRMGIEVAPPDVNASAPDFTVAGGRILFGLAAIKGCGLQASEAIAAERLRGGPYRDLFDFCGRLDPSVVNRTAVESLAKAGALDSLGAHRGALLAGVERALAAGASRLADRRSGQKNLFESVDDAPQAAAPSSLPDVPPLSDLEMRSNEKEVLGYYVHSHPLAEHRDMLEAICTHGTAGLGEAKAKSEVVIGGLVAALKLSNVKQPRQGSTHTRYAMFDLEDMDGLVRSICWPEDYARLGDHLRADAVVVVAGSIDRRAGSEETNLIVNDVVPIAEAWKRPVRSVTVRLVENRHDQGTLDRLAEVVRRHVGQVPLRLVLELGDGRRVLMEADRHAVAWSQALHAEIVDVLGPGCVRAAITLASAGAGSRRRDAESGRRGPPGRTPAGVG